MLIIIILITIILLIILIICIIYILCYNKKKDKIDSKIMNEINIEFKGNQYFK